MFERFTDRARRALVCAQEEARLLNHNFIGTEHLLLGLIREGDGVAAKALASVDISLDVVRAKVEETIGPAGTSLTGSPAFTPRAKRVLELSLREALQLGHRYIGTEHILLGLVREGDGVAAQVLISLGADLGRLRQRVLEEGTVPRGPLSTTVYLRPTPSGAPQQPRRFPDDLLAPVPLEDVPAGARVELFYRGNEVIEGTVAGTDVRLVGRVGSPRGRLKGTWGQTAVGANWRVGDKLRTPGGRSQGIITGRFGDDPVKLRGYFHLGLRYLADQTDIDGELCGNSLRATVSAADGGLGSTSAVVAEGTLGEEAFELFSALSDDLTKAVVRGSFGGRTVALDATRQEPAEVRPAEVRIVGEYAGPLPFLAVIVGVVVHFL